MKKVKNRIVKSVNISAQVKADLMTIPGIVNVTAERIMVHRECFILYQSVEDNIGVRGIGTKTFGKFVISEKFNIREMYNI